MPPVREDTLLRLSDRLAIGSLRSVAWRFSGMTRRQFRDARPSAKICDEVQERTELLSILRAFVTTAEPHRWHALCVALRVGAMSPSSS